MSDTPVISISAETFQSIIRTKKEFANNSKLILDKQIEAFRIEKHMKDLLIENCQAKKAIISRLEQAFQEIEEKIPNGTIEEIAASENKANEIFRELNQFDENNERAFDYQSCIARVQRLEQEIRDLLLRAQEIERQEHNIDVPSCSS